MKALADLTMTPTSDGGLMMAMPTPCRSLLLHVDTHAGTDGVLLGVQITPTGDDSLAPGTALHHAELLFWAHDSELHIRAGTRFELRYPKRVVGAGVVTEVLPA